MTAVGVEGPGLDPRPQVSGTQVIGVRCRACAHPTVDPVDCCPLCGAGTAAASFGPAGTVFSGTVLRIPVGDRQPPISLAYVDLDEGPRVLAHGRDPAVALRPGERVTVCGTTADGDPQVSP